MACVGYVQVPVDLEAAPAAYRARQVDSMAFRVLVDSLRRLRPGIATMESEFLAFSRATWVIRPERARRRAEVAAAEAAVITAGGRPGPGVGAELERDIAGQEGDSPWMAALSGLFRFELGGKRAARIARARAGVLAARAREEEAEQAQVAAVAAAFAEHLRARSQLEGLTGLLRRHETLVELVQSRHLAGAVGASELARARGERDAVTADQLLARREAAEAASRLREVVGVPMPWFPMHQVFCDRLDAGSVDSLGRFALIHRRDLLRALAEYQEAEGDVRIAAAESWPDLELGPGLSYDHGVGKWTTGLGLPTLPLHYRGPLAEAEARRAVAGARVAEAQVAVLSEVQGALDRCVAAREVTVELERLRQAAESHVTVTYEAFERGEVDGVVFHLAALVRDRWGTRVSEARSQEQLARLALNRALGGVQTDGRVE